MSGPLELQRATAVKKKIKFTKRDKFDYLNRVAKRAARASGMAVDKPPIVWLCVHPQNVEATFGVEAATRSEARSKLKKLLKLKSTTGWVLEKTNVQN